MSSLNMNPAWSEATTATATSTTEGAERRPSRRGYPNVLRAIMDAPWAVRRETLDVLVEVMNLRAKGAPLTEEQIGERIGAGPATRGGYQQGQIAVIPIYGMIMPRATFFSQISGGTSLTAVQQQLKQAVADEAVGSILLDVSSPGGSSALVPETAAMIRAAAKRKPVLALANTDAGSAAYWLAAQAGELWVTPSGFVGSIGCYIVHEDYSQANEQDGVQITYISAGRYKVDGNPNEPLSDDARSYLQAIVNAMEAMFVDDVARGRGTSSAAVRSDFGEGRMLMAKQAVSAGMADKVATFDDAIAALAGGKIGLRSGVRSEALPLLASEEEDELLDVDSTDEDDEADQEELAATGGEKQRTAVDPAFARYL